MATKLLDSGEYFKKRCKANLAHCDSEIKVVNGDASNSLMPNLEQIDGLIGAGAFRSVIKNGKESEIVSFNKYGDSISACDPISQCSQEFQQKVINNRFNFIENVSRTLPRDQARRVLEGYLPTPVNENGEVVGFSSTTDFAPLSSRFEVSAQALRSAEFIQSTYLKLAYEDDMTVTSEGTISNDKIIKVILANTRATTNDTFEVGTDMQFSNIAQVGSERSLVEIPIKTYLVSATTAQLDMQRTAQALLGDLRSQNINSMLQAFIETKQRIAYYGSGSGTGGLLNAHLKSGSAPLSIQSKRLDKMTDDEFGNFVNNVLITSLKSQFVDLAMEGLLLKLAPLTLSNLRMMPYYFNNIIPTNTIAPVTRLQYLESMLATTGNWNSNYVIGSPNNNSKISIGASEAFSADYPENTGGREFMMLYKPDSIQYPMPLPFQMLSPDVNMGGMRTTDYAMMVIGEPVAIKPQHFLTWTFPA